MRQFLRLVLCAVLGVMAADCRTTPDARTPEYVLTDLTGAYVAFFDRTQDLATDARVAAFKVDMGARFPGFYDAARMPDMTPEQYDADIAQSFTDFPQRREASGPRYHFFKASARTARAFSFTRSVAEAE